MIKNKMNQKRINKKSNKSQVLLAILNPKNSPKDLLDKWGKMFTDYSEYNHLTTTAKFHINNPTGYILDNNWEDIVSQQQLNLILRCDNFLLEILVAGDFIPKKIIEKIIKGDSKYLPILKIICRYLPSLTIENIDCIVALCNEELLFNLVKNEYINNDRVLQYMLQEIFELTQPNQEQNIREAIASNPNTPTKILVKLAQENNRQIKQILLQNKNTPLIVKERITQQLTPRKKAKDINNKTTYVRKLIKLADSENINHRISVVNNSHTPFSLLQTLANDKRKKVRQIVMMRYTTIAKNPDTAVDVLVELAKKEDKEIYVGLISNPNTPEEVIKKILDTVDISKWEIKTLHQIAKQPQTPAITLEALAKISNRAIDLSLAVNVNTPMHILEKLVTTSNDDIRFAIAENPAIPVDILEYLMTIYPLDKLATVSNPKMCLAIVKNPQATESILESLAPDIVNLDMYTLEKVVQHPNMPMSILEKLSDSQYALVQRGVAKNPKATVAIWRNIMKHKSSIGGFEGIASNPNTPVDILEELLDNSIEQGFSGDTIPVYIANHPNTPVYLLEKLVAIASDTKNNWTKRNINTGYNLIVSNCDVFRDLLVALAKNPLLPINYLRLFIEKANFREMKWAIAENPRTPIDILESLSTDTECYYSLARNPALPSHIAQTIVNNCSNNYTLELLFEHNQHLNQKVLDILAVKKNLEIRVLVAKYPHTSVDILSRLLGNVNMNVREAVKNNPHTPLSLIQEAKMAYYLASFSNSTKELATLATTPWHNIKGVVASNIFTSTATLEKLSNDSIDFLFNSDGNAEYRFEQVFPTIQSLVKNIATPEKCLNLFVNVFTENEQFTQILQQIIYEIEASMNTSYLKAIECRNQILESIALHPQTNINILNKLFQDRNSEMIKNIEKQYHIQNNYYYREKYNNKSVKIAIAKSKNVSLSLLQQLIEEDDRQICQEARKKCLQKYPESLLEILKFYSNSSQPLITRVLVLRHPQMPEEILRKKVRSLYWLERLSVAMNPNTPDEIKQQLSNDSNTIVRHVVSNQLP